MHPANYFRALADETRLRIVNLLLEQELSVNEIARILEMGQSRISRHLKILADRGFLFCRRDGLWAFYSVASGGEGRRLIDGFSFLFDGNPNLIADRQRARQVLSEGSAETTRFFNKLAGDWDRMKRQILGDLDVYREIESWIPAGSVSDLGCGTGDLLLPVSRKARKVIGVDSSSKMLEKARLRFAGQRGRIEVRMGELEHLPFRDGEVGCVLINMVLHHLPKPLAGLMEANRVLEADGTLIVVELGKHTNELMRSRYGDRRLGFRPGELRDWIQVAGFAVKEMKNLPVREGLILQFFFNRKEKEAGGT